MQPNPARKFLDAGFVSFPIRNRAFAGRATHNLMNLFLCLRSKTVALSILAIINLVVAAKIDAASSGQVTINRTTIDYSTNRITIVGTNFGSSTPSVTLQGASLSVVNFNASTGTIIEIGRAHV